MPSSLSSPTAPPLRPIVWLHTLHLYGTAAVTAFAWAMARFLGWNADDWIPLWACGALLIFNADRLRLDPADAWNVPDRARSAAALRAAGITLVVAAAVTLLAIPTFRRDWTTLGLVIGGAIVCLAYSFPFAGFRFKDLPILKTFFAPTVVAASIFTPLFFAIGDRVEPAQLGLVSVHAWGLLLFNMILCDHRDVAGDRRFGVISLPIALGEKRTRFVLWGLVIGIEALALCAPLPAGHALAWRILGVLTPLYLSVLLLALRRPRDERFHEWWVEGMFFLPLLAIALEAALT